MLEPAEPAETPATQGACKTKSVSAAGGVSPALETLLLADFNLSGGCVPICLRIFHQIYQTIYMYIYIYMIFNKRLFNIIMDN